LSLAGPLALSFDKKVRFYKKWKYLFPAMLLPALFYMIWDCWFTSMGIWDFSPLHITGFKLINLPIEEVLFFFVVPYCCIFIYECIRCYFPSIKSNTVTDRIFMGIAAVVFILGVVFHNLYYTGYTFLLFGAFVALFYGFKMDVSGFKSGPFLVSYAVILIPFLLVNGFLTAIPVVLYNDAENLGIRIYSIPVEDCFYGWLLFFMNVVIYEKLRSRGPVHNG
jgi:lycopene cyclase domain-containing protein